MKTALQYVNDINGKTHAIQVPLTEWEKMLNKLKKYEQALKLKSDLKDAFIQVSAIRKSKKPKQTLTDFLNEL